MLSNLPKLIEYLTSLPLPQLQRIKTLLNFPSTCYSHSLFPFHFPATTLFHCVSSLYTSVGAPIHASALASVYPNIAARVQCEIHHHNPTWAIWVHCLYHPMTPPSCCRTRTKPFSLPLELPSACMTGQLLHSLYFKQRLHSTFSLLLIMFSHLIFRPLLSPLHLNLCSSDLPFLWKANLGSTSALNY